MKPVTSADFDSFIADNDVAVIDFTATWCGPCQMLKPVLEQLEKDYEGKLSIGAVDIDQSNDIASKYRVMSVPTVMVFKGGEKVETIVGAQPKPAFTKVLDTLVG